MNKRCSNCGRINIISSGDSATVCKYCGTEFPHENIVTNDFLSSNPKDYPAKQLFNIKVETFENNFCEESWGEMCAWINSGDTSATCLDGLEDIAIKYSEWSTVNVNPSLMNSVESRVRKSFNFEHNEIGMFYKDSGVFSKGKTGVLITNKHIFNVKKNKIETLAISDIYSIHARSLLNEGAWFFNSNEHIEIDNMVCTSHEQGVIMAFICSLARECQSSDYTIKVYG